MPRLLCHLIPADLPAPSGRVHSRALLERLAEALRAKGRSPVLVYGEIPDHVEWGEPLGSALGKAVGGQVTDTGLLDVEVEWFALYEEHMTALLGALPSVGGVLTLVPVLWGGMEEGDVVSETATLHSFVAQPWPRAAQAAAPAAASPALPSWTPEEGFPPLEDYGVPDVLVRYYGALVGAMSAVRAVRKHLPDCETCRRQAAGMTPTLSRYGWGPAPRSFSGEGLILAEREALRRLAEAEWDLDKDDGSSW